MNTPKKHNGMIKLTGICLVLLSTWFVLAQAAFAQGDNLRDKMSELLASMQANGEYVLGAYVTGKTDASEGQIIITTTDGKKVFDDAGQMQESTDRNGNKTFYQNGVPVKVVDASGQVVSVTNIQAQPQDGSKWLDSHDCLGNVERRRMNSQGEMIERVDQQGVTYKNEVMKNAQGKTLGVIETDQQTGAKTTRYFDQATGDIAGVLNPDGDFIQMKYVKDDKGRKVSSYELNTRTGLVTQKSFDEMGRETQVISPNGELKTITYETDAQGHVISTNESIQNTNANSKQPPRQVHKVFDEANRVLSETDSLGRTVKYDYVVGPDKKVLKVIEDETIVNESGKTVKLHRVREMDRDGRVKSLIEGLHKTVYSYAVGENGEVTSVKESKYILSSNQKLYDMVTMKTPQGLPTRCEKWEMLGPTAKRHSVTHYINDPVKGQILETLSINDLGEITKTKMDGDGLPIANETWQVNGPKLKRHSVTTIKTDARTKLTASTESINDLGERTKIQMDENGAPVRSENWSVLGPNLKRHTVTQMETNRGTNQTTRTVSTNDLGDVTVSVMDENGLPVSSESHEVLGPLGGRHKVSRIISDPATGLSQSIRTTDALRESVTTMDANGMATRSENKDYLGPRLKRKSVTMMTNDENTGLVRATSTLNDLGDKINTTMDGNGLAVAGETWNALGALLKRHSLSVMSSNPDTGLMSETKITNDLGDVTTTRMDGNGLAVSSDAQNALGALLKRHSLTTIVSDLTTGLSTSTDTIDDLGDRTVTQMDKEGSAVSSESWNVLGPTLKRHSTTTIKTNTDTGLTAFTSSVNDLGDRTESTMDEEGLAVSSESWVTLGAIQKRHSQTLITTNRSTGMTDATDTTDDLGDRTRTTMDKNGLSVSSEGWNTLGALLKRHSVTAIHTNESTGMPAMTKNVNDLGDWSVSQMDAQGMVIGSYSKNALGARKKRASNTAISCDPATGMTRFTKNVNELGEVTYENKDANGFTVNSMSRGVLGARKKRDSWRTVETNPQTGVPVYSTSVNTLGDFSETWMDENGFAVSSRSQDVLGATAGRNKTSTMKNRLSTGMVESSESFDALHVGPSTTYMDENGLAYFSESVSRYGATAGAEKKTDMNTDLDTGVTRSTYTSDRLHQGPVITLMDENGLPMSSSGTDTYGATAGRTKVTQMENDQDTGITTRTLTQDALHTGNVESRMDENGLAYYSHSFDRYGVLNGREKTTLMTTRSDIGTLERSSSFDGLHVGAVTTLMNEHGLAYFSSGTDRYGAEDGRHKETKIFTRSDLGTSERTETTDALHVGPVVSLMDKHGLAYQSLSTDVHGPLYGRTKQTHIFTRADIGTTEMTRSSDGLHTGDVVTWMDQEGAAFRSRGTDKFGPENGREKVTEIVSLKDTGLTQATYTSDGLHLGAVVTTMDAQGMPMMSVGTDLYGPKDGRKKTTHMRVDKKTGITRESTTLDALHEGPTVTLMDGNGLATQSTAKSKYGPSGARLQKTLMTTDPNTGLTLVSDSQSLSADGSVVVSKTRTENDPVLGLPRTATSESLYGAWKVKTTDFTMDPKTGLTLRSKSTDKGGYTVNQHNEFGVEKSMRYNELGAVKESTTTNTLNIATGIPLSSVSQDRKGSSTSTFNADGIMTVSTRTNAGAHYVPSETTRVTTFNIYTGSPFLSVSTDAHGSTEKTSDMDGFMEKTVRTDQWGERSTTTYTNNRESGLPEHSLTSADSGTTESWYEVNGLALRSEFKAAYGLNSKSENFYDNNLDMRTSKSVDERGNVSVSMCNAAGEVAQSFSKSGVTYMDLYNNRAASSNGPSGSTTYSYSGRWLDSTTNVNKKGETSTSYMDHRPNGAARAVTTKDGTTNYQNSYNSRGFVTYRTESKGNDKGFSRFNEYGDQLYTEWTGSIKSEGADEYGNQFLGGSWKSETTYSNSSRGDVLSWTTKSSWTGKQKYAEIGHYEFVCDMGYDSKGACKGGHEDYKVDQSAHVETVGKTDPTKTEYPESSPESDQWVLSHLSGSLADKITFSSQPSQTMQAFETDATKPGYHSDYQRTVLLSLAAQGYAEELKASFKPMVTRIQELMQSFAKTGDLQNLYRICTYASLDANTFRAQFKQAANKGQFLLETVDATYYYFSGEHVSQAQLNLSSVNVALNLLNRPTTLSALQDWLEFIATPEEQLAVSQALLATDTETDASQTAADQLAAKQKALSALLRDISQANLGQAIPDNIIQIWVEKTMTSLTDARDMATRMANNIQITQSPNPSAAAGVLLTASGVTVDENKVTTQVTGASVQSDNPDLVQNAKAKKDAQKTEATNPLLVSGKSAEAGSGFEKVAGTYELKLSDQTAGVGKEGTSQGVAPRTIQHSADGSGVTYQYSGKEPVDVVARNAQGKKLGTARYQGGLLQQVSLPNGTQITITYEYKADHSLKGVEIKREKGEEGTVEKYDEKGNLLATFVKDGDRMKLEEKKEKDADALADVLDAANQRHKDERLNEQKAQELQLQQVQPK